MVPFLHAPAGIFDMGSLPKLFFIAGFLHGIRKWRLMLHMELEENSMFEGPALPFFRLLPKGNSYWWVRLIYEPLTVYALSLVLGNLFIIQRSLMLYLQISSLLLFLKQYVAWFKLWSYIRNLMDMANAGPIVAQIVANRASEDDMARVHLASLPKNLSPEIRKAILAHLARAFSPPEDESTKPPRSPEAGSSGLKFIFLMLVIAAFFCLATCGPTLRRVIAQLARPANAQEASIAARPSPVQANGASKNASVEQAAAFRSLSYLGGIWAGSSISAEQAAMCALKLEIRPLLRQRSPHSPILTGIPTTSEIIFHVERLIDSDAECPMTALTAAPFGVAQLAVEWKNGTCPGGQMLLTRAGR